MNHTDMMNYTHGWMSGWMGGEMWIWTVIGVLVVVLLVVLIGKLYKKCSYETAAPAELPEIRIWTWNPRTPSASYEEP